MTLPRSLVFLALAACRTVPSPGPEAAAPPACDDVDPWAALLAGAEELAACAFERRGGDEALRGRVALARLQGDAAGLAAVLADLPGDATPALVLDVTEAALDLGLRDEAVLPRAEAACALAADPAHASDARSVCARLAVARMAERTDRCTAGCDVAHRIPMVFAGNSPVVAVSVNGHPPVPFIVDTGAASSLLTRQAMEDLGVQVVPGTAHEVSSTAGSLATEHALVTLALGDLVISEVDVVVLDLPYGTIAGILSPHATLSELAVTLDFRAAELEVAPTAPADPEAAAMPLRFMGGNPVVFVESEGRPVRPFLLDTGAVSTRVRESWDRLGPPLPRAGESTSMGAGGGTASAWTTQAAVAMEAGDLAWTAVNPTIVAAGDDPGDPVHPYGLLGMDLLMGRRVTLDPAARQLRISREAALAPWDPGAVARFRIHGSALPEPFTYEETVLGREGGTVEIGARLATTDRETTLGYRMDDGWSARGTWFVTRSIRGGWVETAEGREPLEAGAVIPLLAQAFAPFRSLPGEARIDVLAGASQDGASRSCTEVTLPASGPGGEGTLSFVECPADPWRTARVRLEVGGELAWEYLREGFSDGRGA